MDEYKKALQEVIQAIDEFDAGKNSPRVIAAKALLARPEQEQIPLQIESRPDGWWLLTSPDHPGLMLAGKDLAQLLADTGNSFRILMKLDRESVEPAAAEKAREWNNEAEQLELLADRLTWPQPIRQDLDLAEAAIREYIKLRFYVPSPPAATGEKCNHDLQLPGHTINVLGPLDAVCKVCKEEWHLPGDKK